MPDAGQSPVRDAAETKSQDDLRQNAERAADFLKAIANPNRLMILCALAGAKGELSVSELELQLQVRQPTLSQQLARLREEGLVATRRDGKSIYYRLANDRAAMIVMLLYDWYCANTC